MIIMAYKNMILGGAELLLLNLAIELEKNAYDVVVAFETASQEILDESIKRKVHYIKLNFYDELVSYINSSIGKSECYIIVATFLDYLFLKKYLSKMCNVKIIYYSMDSSGFILGRKIPFFKSLFLRKIGETIQNGIDLKEIYFLDNDTVAFTEEYYSIKIERPMILGIPHAFLPLDINMIKKRISQKPFIILTAARAEFPFKGYVLGLIDIVNELIKENFNLKLIIVSKGPNEDEIINKLGNLPEHTKDKFVFYNGLPVDELNMQIANASLAIGMGTFLIDAASMGVISLAAKAYSRKCKTIDKFFYENQKLGASDNDDYIDTKTSIENIYKLNNDDILKYSIKSYITAKRIFSFDDKIKLLKKEAFLPVQHLELSFFVKIMLNLYKLKSKLSK